MFKLRRVSLPRDDDAGAFGMLVAALCPKDGARLFPPADADDLLNGAKIIPMEVTQARRAGQTVRFVWELGQCHWEMPDGSIVHQ